MLINFDRFTIFQSKKKPFILLILIGLLIRILYVIYDIFTNLLGSGPDLEDLLPGYILFVSLAIIISIIMLYRYGLKDLLVVMSLSWLLIILFTIIDIGGPIYNNIYNYYGDVQVENLRDYYKNNKVNGAYLEDVIWYSQKQTVYVFFKNGNILESDISDILKTIKPVDDLDITILLINPIKKERIIKRFTNNKRAINTERDEYLLNRSSDYFIDETDETDIPFTPGISRMPKSQKGLVEVSE